MALIDGDFSTRELDFRGKIGYKYNLIPALRLCANVQLFKLNSSADINHWWLSENLNLEYKILPHDKLSPYFYGGPGVMHFIDNSETENLTSGETFFKINFGAGMEYTISDRVSVELNADYNTTFSDKIDDEINGRRDDFFFNFGIGINYHFGSNKVNNNTKIQAP
jgi:curli production assembly/transport component CsgG